jgi:UDP-perosamine 4-acetyltransferase
MKRILVWGAGGHACVVIEAIEATGQFEIAGLIDTVNPHKAGTQVMGYPILGGYEQAMAQQAMGVDHWFLAFGSNTGRETVYRQGLAIGCQFPTIVHPRAWVSPSAKLGAGCFVASMAVVSASSELGAQTIVNSAAVVEHDCKVGSSVHIAPTACLAGHCTVGDRSTVGAGTSMRDRTEIGSDSIVGAGSVVTRNMPSHVVAYGCPAKIIRSLVP